MAAPTCTLEAARERLPIKSKLGVQVEVVLVTFRLRFESHSGHLQASLSKLLTYCVLRPTQPSILSRTEKSSGL